MTLFGDVLPAAAIGAVMLLTLAKMLIGHRERLAELRGGRGQLQTEPDVAARLARLEHAVDAIAVEIERNGEAQRYLMKVLAEHRPIEPVR
jgi:hypothetical protein